jgi:hypothetical protein
MKYTFSKYKYHHRILIEISCREKGWHSESRSNGSGLVGSPSNEYLSEMFKIPVFLVKEITSELKELKCIRPILSSEGVHAYFIGDKASEYIDSRYFIHKRNKYLKDLFILNIKDFLLIITSVLAISAFFKNTNENKKYIKEIERDLLKVESIQKSLKLELENRIKSPKDSLLNNYNVFF